MALIPAPTITMQDLAAWEELKKQMAVMKEKESALRRKIVAAYFPEPKEGTNKMPLENGWLLNMQRVVDRKIDMGELQAATGPEGIFIKAGFDANPLIEWEPKLKLAVYRALPKDKKTLFEHVLIIKDGSPQVSIVLPAAAKAAQEAQAAAIANAAPAIPPIPSVPPAPV